MRRLHAVHTWDAYEKGEPVSDYSPVCPSGTGYGKLWPHHEPMPLFLSTSLPLPFLLSAVLVCVFLAAEGHPSATSGAGRSERCTLCVHARCTAMCYAASGVQQHWGGFHEGEWQVGWRLYAQLVAEPCVQPNAPALAHMHTPFTHPASLPIQQSCSICRRHMHKRTVVITVIGPKHVMGICVRCI